ncbi:CaiB/BaiF CoA transferase family protein [Sporolituus thermophilus]|uniref:CoA:oxalate CoA-transferase n=1 Tax=Sporolituus thermophilus DSM 23256 TaxID=1123285 RepID=A0A1G7J7B1_9FIRM|nr:CaiB/BaiF CoA-transferase family protein [Sporolituus thermophilus]SDF20758.1 CoA:oxalate CoA-transferase [Sporolituus thermophilus DSM 23256]
MKPLQGVVVLDLTRVLAGPYAAMMMADFGANVIKIEPPGVGDDSRAFGPFVGKESAYFMSLNRNKRSMTLNLKHSEARELFKEMVKKADVVLENYRPGTMEKFGLGYDDLKKINPRIIYAACSGFGHSGPYMDKPAYDVIVQAMGGIMSITGQENGEPTRVGASIGDITAGLFTMIGVMMALYHRSITGEGQKVDVGMLDCQVAILENAIARYLTSGIVPKPLGNRHPSITPFEAFTAKDGYVIVGAGNDRLWEKLCNLIGRPDLVADERFVTNAKRTQNVKELKVILDDVFSAKTVDEWLKELEEAGIPCGPINTIDRVINDPQVQAREMIVETDHPVAGKIKMAGVPIKMSATPGAVERPAPLLGQHTEEILAEVLGLSAEEVAALRAKDVL